MQPENRGTGVGILLPVLHILERDAGARIVILLSDHHIRVESCLIHSSRAALETRRLRERGRGTLLLGVTPEEPELRYIVPIAAGR